MKLSQMHKFARLFASSSVVCASALFFLLSAVVARGQGDGSARMRAIKPFIGYEETFQWSDVPEILAAGAQEGAGEDATLEYAWASDLFFQKEVWQLSFRYKNVRTIDVEFPAENGELETKRVWYLVYSVTNTGERLRAALDEERNEEFRKEVDGEKGENVSVSQRVVTLQDKKGKIYEFPRNNLIGVFKPELVKFDGKKKDENGVVEGTVTFAPRLAFASATIHDRLTYEKIGDLFFGQTRGAEEAIYFDKILPLAFAKIVKQEGRGDMIFYDSARMAAHPIKPGETVWGIATWVDVDPRIDRFSIYISGLTNALRWEITDEAGESEVFGAGRDVLRKVLKLNFYNPGDEAHSGGKEIYNNLPGELDYQWIYM